MFLDPSSRWNTTRDVPEMRLYNSLPRGKDINNYPTLANYQNKQTKPNSPERKTSSKHPSPSRKTQSMDMYHEHPSQPQTQQTQEKVPQPSETKQEEPEIDPVTKRPIRINPLIKYASVNRQCSCCNGGDCKESKKKKLQTSNSEESESSESPSESPMLPEKKSVEKKVNFGGDDQIDDFGGSPGRSKTRRKDMLKSLSEPYAKVTPPIKVKSLLLYG